MSDSQQQTKSKITPVHNEVTQDVFIDIAHGDYNAAAKTLQKGRLSVLEAITHDGAGGEGAGERLAARATFVMWVIETIAEDKPDVAVNILAQDHAVYQLSRNGQAKAVLNFLSTCTKPQQAKVLAADEALFGLLEYLPKSEFKQLKSLYDALPQATRKNIEYRPEKERNDQQRNRYLAQHYGLVASKYKGRKSPVAVAKPLLSERETPALAMSA